MTKLDAPTRREMIRLYTEERYSLDAVGQVVGVSRPTVHRVLSEAGIARRAQGNPKAQPQTIDPAQIVARYQAGEGLCALAAEAHCHSSRIRAILVAAGLPIRTVGKKGRTPAAAPAPAAAAVRVATSRRTCRLCDARIAVAEWSAHRALVHGIDSQESRTVRAIEAPITERQLRESAPAPAQPPCPGCRHSPCITPLCCGPRLRALAQHGRKDQAA